MGALIMSGRSTFLLAAMFVVLSAFYARADSGQTAASDTVYERNSRWVIVTDGSGKICSLVVPYGKNEIVQILVENKSNILFGRFLFMRKYLNISMSGRYDLELIFDGGFVFKRHAEAYEVEGYSGVIVELFIPDLLPEISKNRTLKLKVGEVSYGNYDLTFLKAGIPRLYDCLVETTKWDVTASLSLRKQLSP